MLFVTTSESAVLAYSFNKYCFLTLSWRQYLDGKGVSADQLSSPSVAGGVVYMSSLMRKEVVGLNADSGGFMWVSSGYNQLLVAPVVVDGNVFVVDSRSDDSSNTCSISAYGLVHRQQVEQANEQDVAAQVAILDTYYAYGTTDDMYSLGSNFDVTIAGHVYDMSPIASIGTNVDKHGTVYKYPLQRVFQFNATDLIGARFQFFFRLPIAGKTTTTRGMNFIGVNWFSPSITDCWQSDEMGTIQYYLGSYDPTTWVKYSDMSLNVQYMSGQYCPIGNGYYRQMSVTFKCSSSSVIKYKYFEHPRCIRELYH